MEVHWDTGGLLGNLKKDEIIKLENLTPTNTAPASIPGGALIMPSEPMTLSVPAAVVMPAAPSLPEKSIDMDDEEQVRQGLESVNVMMSSLDWPIECYYMDHKNYPLNGDQLTTPVAYVSDIPVDPFSKDKAKLQVVGFNEWKEGQTPSTSNDKLKYWRIYSVGPDQVDDKGLVIYNPSKGLRSSGDIVVSNNPELIKGL